MKIALIGATGYVGSKILNEALNRGHQVTAIVKNIDKLPQHAQLTGKSADVFKDAELAQVLAGHDAVISAYSPGIANPDVRRLHAEAAQHIVNATKAAKVSRLLAVGGAGSLEVAPGVEAVDTPDFPEQWKGGALGTRDVRNLLRGEKDLNWSFLSPSAMLQPGQRTGKFRLGGTKMLFDAKGESHISVEDYAVALIDELEKPQHSRQQFTVGY